VIIGNPAPIRPSVSSRGPTIFGRLESIDTSGKERDEPEIDLVAAGQGIRSSLLLLDGVLAIRFRRLIVK
jgi:hypothetical protein